MKKTLSRLDSVACVTVGTVVAAFICIESLFIAFLLYPSVALLFDAPDSAGAIPRFFLALGPVYVTVIFLGLSGYLAGSVFPTREVNGGIQLATRGFRRRLAR